MIWLYILRFLININKQFFMDANMLNQINIIFIQLVLINRRKLWTRFLLIITMDELQMQYC